MNAVRALISAVCLLFGLLMLTVMGDLQTHDAPSAIGACVLAIVALIFAWEVRPGSHSIQKFVSSPESQIETPEDTEIEYFPDEALEEDSDQPPIAADESHATP